MHDDLLLQIPTSLIKLPMLGKEIISSPSFSEGPSVLRNVYIFMPTIAVARNKNRYLMSYLMWRVLTGFHEEIKDLFSSGWPHQICTKLVLWIIQAALSSNQSRMFGRHSNLSSTPNVAQLVGGQDDSTIVPMYDRGFYFDDNTVKTALKGITKMHHFRFSNTHPGKVFVKSKSSDSEWLITLQKATWVPTSDNLPNLIVPKGLFFGEAFLSF